MPSHSCIDRTGSQPVKAYENADVLGASLVVVDALDERAASFYAAHGFIRLPESLRLVLPMQTISNLFGVRA